MHEYWIHAQKMAKIYAYFPIALREILAFPDFYSCLK